MNYNCIPTKKLLSELKSPTLLTKFHEGVEKIVLALSSEEGEQLLLGLWASGHRGDEGQMQYRVMSDDLFYDIQEKFNINYMIINYYYKSLKIYSFS